jgi:hypothetical protein
MSTRANKAASACRSASRGIDFRPTISTFRVVLGHNKIRVLRRMPMADQGSSRGRRRRLDRTSLQPTPTPLQGQCHVDGTHLALRASMQRATASIGVCMPGCLDMRLSVRILVRARTLRDRNRCQT